MDEHTVALIVIAVLNALTAWLTWSAKRDIRKVEIATNSLTDRLVAKTDQEAHARGVKDQKEKNST